MCIRDRMNGEYIKKMDHETFMEHAKPYLEKALTKGQDLDLSLIHI